MESSPYMAIPDDRIHLNTKWRGTVGRTETDVAHYRIGDQIFERGNFAFVYEKTGNPELFLEFLNAEKNAEINYQDSLAGFRRGIEGLSYYLQLLQKNGAKPTSEEIKAAMKENESRVPWDPQLKKEAEKANAGRTESAGSTPRKYSSKSIAVYSWKLLMMQNAEPEMTSRIISPRGYGDLLRSRLNDIYSEASDNGSHFAAELKVDLSRFIENVYKAVRIMLISDLSEWDSAIRSGYKHSLRPVGKYYPLTKEEKNTLGGIRGTWQRDLYYCPDDRVPAFYLLWRHSQTPLPEEISGYNAIRELRGRRRVENALLTGQAAAGSAFVIKPDDTIIKTGTGTEGSGEIIDLFRLPGMPHAMSEQTLRKISEEKKCRICRTMMDTIADMHKAGIAHRALLPSSFCLCETQGGLLPVLTDFAVAKNYDRNKTDTEGTVICGKDYSFCSAPEFLQNIGADDLSRSKMMDVYSLGIIMEYILSGGNGLLWKDAEKKRVPPDILKLFIPDRYAGVLSGMTRKNPDERISLEDARTRFDTVSLYDISISFYSAKGKRRKQEDAFFIGKNAYQGGDTESDGNVKTYESTCMGVFDGIGFAGNGREISKKAAEIFVKKKEEGLEPGKAAEETEEELGNYMEDSGYFDGGCTIAEAEIGKDEIAVLSAGDSSVYLYENGLLTKLTRPDRIDYRGPGGAMRHELSMYLGISLTEGIPVSLYRKKAGFRTDSRVFICTDGAETVLGEDFITSVFRAYGSVADVAGQMAKKIRQSGSEDNATFIVAGFEKK